MFTKGTSKALNVGIPLGGQMLPISIVGVRLAANIFKSNMEAIAAFKKHGKRVPIGFFPGKLIHRGKQFFSRNIS